MEFNLVTVLWAILGGLIGLVLMSPIILIFLGIERSYRESEEWKKNFEKSDKEFLEWYHSKYGK